MVPIDSVFFSVLQGRRWHRVRRPVHRVVRPVRVQAVRDRVLDGAPADADRLSVRPAVRRVRADHGLLGGAAHIDASAVRSCCTIILWTWKRLKFAN